MKILILFLAALSQLALGQPFDTCHVQIDWWDREAWFIQDHATGTVRAFADANGEVVKQYRFDAFGNLKSQDTFALASSGGLFAGFRQRLGHQGLFAERVDSDTTSATLSMNPNAEVWYQSRSRWYVPELGRFMTSDPNSTGVPTISSLAMLGRMPVGPPDGSFNWNSHYGDGWDTYTAYSANPVMNRDPSGLSSDSFAEIDDIINLHYASMYGTLAKARINVGESWSKINSYVNAGYAWGELIASRDIDIATSLIIAPFFSSMCFEEGTLVLEANGKKTRIDEIEIGTQIFDTGIEESEVVEGERLVYTIQVDWGESHTTAKLLRPVGWSQSIGIDLGSYYFVQSQFEESSFGVLKLASIERFGYNSGDTTTHGMVTGQFKTTNSRTIKVYLKSSGSPLVCTPEHRFFSRDRGGWVEGQDLREGESLRTNVGNIFVDHVILNEGSSSVYNIEVAGAHSYYVGESGVLAHNECILSRADILRQNVAKGGRLEDAFGDFLSRNLSGSGLQVQRQAFFRTPQGGRYLDFVVRNQDGIPIMGFELKAGLSRYHSLQKTKDAFISLTEGFPIKMIRIRDF